MLQLKDTLIKFFKFVLVKMAKSWDLAVMIEPLNCGIYRR